MPNDLREKLRGLSIDELRRVHARVASTGRRDDGRLRKRVREGGVVPLSFGQERLWFMDQLGLAKSAYNVPISLRLRGVLDMSALRSGLCDLVRRHESLRTRFVDCEGQPGQLVQEGNGFDVEVVDLSGMEAREREEVVRKRIQDEIEHSFDLGAGAPFRASLLRLGPQEHLLNMTAHHIVFDGWSAGVLMRDLGALYGQHLRGGASALPELPIQYADYALWQREWLEGEVLEKRLRYWVRKLSGAPQALNLPTDHPRPAVASFRGEAYHFEVQEELHQRLRQLARSEGVTLYMLLLAAFQVLLSRWSGQTDVVVGSPVAGRGRLELENLIGFFVNTIVLRTDLSDNPTFRELLAQVRKNVLEAFEHQDLPFERLVAEIHPKRDLSRNAIFQVMLTLQKVEPDSLRMDGLQVQLVRGRQVAAKFDLCLDFMESEGGLSGRLEYAADLFERRTIEELAGKLRTILDSVAADPTCRAHEPSALTPSQCVHQENLPLPSDRPSSQQLSDAERALVLCKWNRTDDRYPTHLCVHQLFEQQVRRTPTATALVYEQLSLTYAELNTQANRLAHHLIALDVRPEDRVAICITRGAAMVIGLLATLKAGAAYVPLDPAHPSERLTRILTDAAPRVALCDAAGRSALGTSARDPLIIIDLHTAPILESDLPDEDPDPNTIGLTPRHLAYVIYTSGSTGCPKGVMVEHRDVAVLWHGLELTYDASPGCRRIALNASLNFDASVQQIVQLLSGRVLFVVPERVRRDPVLLGKFIEDNRIDAIDCTPSQLALWLETGALLNGSHRLRMALVGGEAIDATLWRQLSQDSNTQFCNVYGPTECTVDVTLARIARDSWPPHMGRPMAGRRIYVLDSRREPVPIGATGEIFVGGAGLARGYLSRPELTAQHFLPDPYSPLPGARMYRTGDLARYLPDGNLVFLGRCDQQLKISGFRIEPAEIEASLAEHAAVHQAVVLAREDRPGEKRLVAYVVSDPERSPPPEELAAALRAHVSTRLPGYMVPAAFVRLDAFPLTANGKLDRRALPAPGMEALARKAYEPPLGYLEQTLAALWEQFLGITGVGRHDNFFALGGDSIRLVQVVHAANRLHLPTTVVHVFRNQTIAELAGALRVCHDPQESHEALPVEALRLPQRLNKELPGGIVDAYPLTSMQKMMIGESLCRRRGAGIYHLQQWILLREPDPSMEAMQAALDLLTAKHPILRTVFKRVKGAGIIQAVKDQVAVPIRCHDLTGKSPEERQLYLKSLLQQDRAEQFSLEDGQSPPWRLQWIQMAADEFVIMKSAHHAADDGWGNQQFLRELFGAYELLKRGRKPRIERAENVFKEFVALERATRRSSEAAAFWRRRKTRTVGIGRLRKEDRLQADEGVEYTAGGADLLDGLLSRSRALNVPLKATLLSAYLDLVDASRGSKRSTVGVVMNGRCDRLSDPFGALGLFWNMVPFSLQLHPSDSDARIRRVHQELMDIEPYSIFPLAGLQRARKSPFYATFNFIDFHNDMGEDTNGLTLRGAEGHGKFHWPLNLSTSVLRHRRALVCRAEYDCEYFNRRIVEELLARYLGILRAIARLGSRRARSPRHIEEI